MGIFFVFFIFVTRVAKNLGQQKTSDKNLSKTELIELLEKVSPEDQRLLSDVLKELETEYSSTAPKPQYDYDEVDLKVQEWADSEEGKARKLGKNALCGFHYHIFMFFCSYSFNLMFSIFSCKFSSFCCLINSSAFSNCFLELDTILICFLLSTSAILFGS